jgi:hypothetical protein
MKNIYEIKIDTNNKIIPLLSSCDQRKMWTLKHQSSVMINCVLKQKRLLLTYCRKMLNLLCILFNNKYI